MTNNKKLDKLDASNLYYVTVTDKNNFKWMHTSYDTGEGYLTLSAGTYEANIVSMTIRPTDFFEPTWTVIGTKDSIIGIEVRNFYGEIIDTSSTL